MKHGLLEKPLLNTILAWSYLLQDWLHVSGDSICDDALSGGSDSSRMCSEALQRDADTGDGLGTWAPHIPRTDVVQAPGYAL